MSYADYVNRLMDSWEDGDRLRAVREEFDKVFSDRLDDEQVKRFRDQVDAQIKKADPEEE